MAKVTWKVPLLAKSLIYIEDPVDKLDIRQAKVVFGGMAPIPKGSMLHLEYPRIGQKPGTESGSIAVWLSPDRILLPSVNIIYSARCDGPLGSIQWKERSSAVFEVVVRKCVIDSDTLQTYLDVDVVAERLVSLDGKITTRLPGW